MFLLRLALPTLIVLFAIAAAQAQQTVPAPRSDRAGAAPAATSAPAAPAKRAQTRGKQQKAGKTARQQPVIPPREPFTAEEDNAAIIPGIPEARFWADNEQDYTRALPTLSGPWLALSSGGADGAFGAGLLAGLSAAGKRPDFALITGVSSGALMAPFVFAGPKYDEQLRAAYTTINAGDVFEVAGKGESFFDTWPLKALIAKQVTPELLADVAAEHRRGRRLFVVTTNLDAERPIGWNMGAIAAAGGEASLKLFREVLLAAGSVPGAFPPVLIDVEANGRRFQEMHADGGMCAQFFIAPESALASTSNYRLPTTDLYIIVNTQLASVFQVTERSLVPIVVRGISVIVKTLTRVMIQSAYSAAKRSGIGFNLATIPATFQHPSQGAFDTEYMKALFNVGFEQGKSGSPFGSEPAIVSMQAGPTSR
jgi:predicted acylesterase/phospholipase RssA